MDVANSTNVPKKNGLFGDILFENWHLIFLILIFQTLQAITYILLNTWLRLPPKSSVEFLFLIQVLHSAFSYYSFLLLPFLQLISITGKHLNISSIHLPYFTFMLFSPLFPFAILVSLTWLLTFANQRNPFSLILCSIDFTPSLLILYNNFTPDNLLKIFISLACVFVQCSSFWVIH